MGADGTWQLENTRVTDGGSGTVWTSYTYSGSSSSPYYIRYDYYDDLTNEVIAWEICRGNSTTSSSDSINRSNGYSFSRDTTLTYHEGSMPTISGTGSGNTWTHETNSHSASTDNATHWWIGNDEGNSWMDSEYHVMENWSGGSHSRREWTEDYSAGTGPAYTENTSDSYGSGTRTTNGSITFGGTGQTTETTTFPETTEALTSHGGRSGPGAMFGLRDAPMGGLPAGVYEGGYVSGPLCDENGMPIMLASTGSPQDAIAASRHSGHGGEQLRQLQQDVWGLREAKKRYGTSDFVMRRIEELLAKRQAQIVQIQNARAAQIKAAVGAVSGSLKKVNDILKDAKLTDEDKINQALQAIADSDLPPEMKEELSKALRAGNGVAGALAKIGKWAGILDSAAGLMQGLIDAQDDADRLKALSKYMKLVNSFNPIPGVSDMIDFYSDAVDAIAGKIKDIQDAIDRRDIDAITSPLREY